MSHNTPEQNEAFRKAWDATNERWRAQQKAYEAQQQKKGQDNAEQS
jgi:hypothetical protein